MVDREVSKGRRCFWISSILCSRTPLSPTVRLGRPHLLGEPNSGSDGPVSEGPYQVPITTYHSRYIIYIMETKEYLCLNPLDLISGVRLISFFISSLPCT